MGWGVGRGDRSTSVLKESRLADPAVPSGIWFGILNDSCPATLQDYNQSEMIPVPQHLKTAINKKIELNALSIHCRAGQHVHYVVHCWSNTLKTKTGFRHSMKKK